LTRHHQSDDTYPPWVVLHLPHDATDIPEGIRSQVLLDDESLGQELLRMTDHHTARLFMPPNSPCVAVRAPVSRLVVDVERFADDAREPMAARGMGVVYTVTSGLKPLRRHLSQAERARLLAAYYVPHHEDLEAAVRKAIADHGRCLVVDCHSFPAKALPYELVDPAIPRPDICIGTDPFHTAASLSDAYVSAFAGAGFVVGTNDPFAGALVPAFAYRRDRRVHAIMVEVNRQLYMSEADGSPRSDFEEVSRKVRHCCLRAIERWQRASSA
jgi:N-formylglutamate deformylase